jgi:large subunit ribosomal protein L32
MPNPKRRHSKQRTAKRRSHDFLTPVNSGACPKCAARRLPHHACPNKECADYLGKGAVVAQTA